MTFPLASVNNLAALNDQGEALVQRWLSTRPSGHGIESIEIIEQPTYRDETPWYVEVAVTYYGREGMQPIRLLAPAINIIATLRCSGTTYLALVEQFRAAVGSKVIGNPSGRMEQGSTVLNTALRELQEELGLPGVAWGDPVDLTDEIIGKPLQASPGTAWEEIYVVHTGAEVTLEQLRRFQGHQAGLAAEGE